MLAVGCGGNGVIEAPDDWPDMALYIAYGTKSLLINRFPLSRYEKEFDLTKVVE
jgi:hypothetical protein